ncbi:MAG: histidine kinase [Chitinophagaceae bacterium]|nr:histidine kinase [Chitinophagaceae bacterium]
MFRAIYIKRFSVVAGFVIFFVTAKAQLPDYHLQLFDYPTGILPSEIIAIDKDQQKLLWILYRMQIQRFDGKEIVNFKPAGELISMLCDKKGRIWVCSRQEVFLFSPITGTFLPVFLDGIEEKRTVGAIHELPDGNVWVITNEGILQYNPDQMLFSPVEKLIHTHLELNTDNLAVFYDHVFFASHTFLYRWNTSTRRLDSLPAKNINGIYPVSKDSLLIASWDNMVRWYDFSSKKIAPVSGPSIDEVGPFSIKSVAPVSPSKFLIAASQGILEYRTDEKRFIKLKFFLNGRQFATNEYASYIFYDSAEGYAWVATTEGIARFAVNKQLMGLIKIRQQYEQISANVDNVRQIVEDKKGNLWVATGYGFASWQKNKNKWQLFPPAKEGRNVLTHESIRGFAYDGKYLLLGPTYSGLWLFDVENYHYKRPVYDDSITKKYLEEDFINHIVTLHNGDHIISARDAMYVLNGKTYHVRKLDSLPSDRGSTNFALQDRKGLIWVGSAQGLYCMDPDYHFLGKLSRNAKDNFITTGFILKDNSFLFSYTNGLYTAHFTDGDIHVEKKTPLFDNTRLSTLYEDMNGVIWAGSDNGIYRYVPNNSKLNLFDRSDNIQGYGFNSNGWFRDKDGILYFCGINGINYWQPETFSTPAQSFEAYISKARVANRDYSMHTFNALEPVKYSERSVGVVFSAAYYNNPEKMRYRYKLQGLDNEWKEIGNSNIVQFTSLAPGKYTLLMEASLNQVDWKKAKNTFSFRILNPFWMTWWFLTSCFLIVAAGVWMIIKNRNRKIAEQKEELETAQAINYFSSSIYETNSVQAILWDVVKNCIARLHFEDCIIYVIDREKNVLVPNAAYRHNTPVTIEPDSPGEIAIGKGITGYVAQTGKAEIVYDTSKDPRYIIEWERKNSEITIPIITEGKVWGVIDCEHSKKGFFKQKHLSILTTIASLCANKIIKARAEAEKARTESILVDTRQKMTEAEMLALRAQMNPHFIFNSLNSINRYIVKSDQATASLYLTRFAKLIRLILDNSNSKSITLANELQALSLYMEMESIRFEKKFTYSIECDATINPETIYVPPLIIQPYVENAIWHGLLHKETAGHLWVCISKKRSNLLQCIIEDDGIGREKAKALKSKSASNKKSLGMKLTENRLGLLSTHLSSEAMVEIEDLQDENGKAKGTKVILNIPVEEE